MRSADRANERVTPPEIARGHFLGAKVASASDPDGVSSTQRRFAHACGIKLISSGKNCIGRPLYVGLFLIYSRYCGYIETWLKLGLRCLSDRNSILDITGPYAMVRITHVVIRNKRPGGSFAMSRAVRNLSSSALAPRNSSGRGVAGILSRIKSSTNATPHP